MPRISWHTIDSPDTARPGVYDVAPPGSTPVAQAGAAAEGK